MEKEELMLRWNRYCDAHNRQGDCILLNEDRTFVEAFLSEEEALKEILNSGAPDFRKNEGFLVPIWEEESYKGLFWVSEQAIGSFIERDEI